MPAGSTPSPISIVGMEALTRGLDPSSPLRLHLIDAAPHMRLFVMGLVLLLVLRFSPKGVLPEQVRHS